MSTINNLLSEQEVMEKLTLAQIVSKDFRTASVFEKYNLDFCCKGNKSFEEACKDQGLNEKEILSEIANMDKSPDRDSMRYDSWQLDFLVDYIVNNHHHYVKEAIPVIAAHSTKVAAVHGKNHPETIEAARIFSIVYKELKQHLMKEEELLFPHIKYLVKVKNNESKYERPFFGSVSNPIKTMEAEHVAAGDGMFDIRKLTYNYAIPPDACNTYSVYYKELKEFEEDLHKHVYLENSILFPKAIALEEKLSQNLAM